ncbi:MAG: DHH family phosphoesterase [Patescibacteria group bacterium]
MVKKDLAQKVNQKIKAAKNILILGHSNPRPDGDSAGSVLALSLYLKSLGKKCTVFSLYYFPQSLAYLPAVLELEIEPERIKINDYDLIFLLDFGEFKNSGLAEKLDQAKKQGTTFINIDHHPNQDEAKDISLVVPMASSTSEILYNLLVAMRAEVNKDMATCLLTGILTDTQNFTNPATTFTAMEVGSELLRLGARLQQITANTWQNKELPILRLWGKVLLRLQEDPETSLATTVITLKDLEEEHLLPEAAEGVANFLNSLGTSKAILVLREEEGGKVKGSLRTTSDDVDVAEIAKKFGGGGHKKAAGFTIPGHIVETDKGWKIVE